MNDLSWEREDDRGHFKIATNPTLVDHDFINLSFASEETYWAKPLPPDQLATLLSNSITLGVYEIQLQPNIPSARSISEPSSPRTPSSTVQEQSPQQQQLKQIGLARFITDHVTTAYLTDVYVAPAYRKYGLGKWLIACCDEVIEAHPALRRALLAASPGIGKPFYEREMGMRDVVEESGHVAIMSKKRFRVPGE
ncbi:hypothetical protein B0A50_01160 [Salinomyces thailandicus]|uniref:N-acetyltransferase domain-containing protein n=1 Tax=Salinomyces thailandicus TaxID=706561 RepID=A0A4U0UCB6_9PEZI|nr:hypothetical protein B0A50_01160 [Salinomyces thailandica]